MKENVCTRIIVEDVTKRMLPSLVAPRLFEEPGTMKEEIKNYYYNVKPRIQNVISVEFEGKDYVELYELILSAVEWDIVTEYVMQYYEDYKEGEQKGKEIFEQMKEKGVFGL